MKYVGLVFILLSFWGCMGKCWNDSVHVQSDTPTSYTYNFGLAVFGLVLFIWGLIREENKKKK